MAPKGSALGVKDILVWSLLVPLIGALQQQPQHNAYPSRLQPDELSKGAATAASVTRRWRLAESSLQTGSLKYHDTNIDDHNKRTRSSDNECALATLSPAEKNAAVRAPPAPGSATTAGLSSRHQARSLQDWKVEDIMLLATVDGKIHARDRKTGAARWQLETDRAMVETVYHARNTSLDEDGFEQDDPLWIVEPSQDGSIYIYTPGSGLGMQKLGFTVKQLVELAPYASEGPPAVAYTAEKKNTLYTIDAATGHILKSFSSSGSTVNDDRSCRRVNPLDYLDEDECEPIGTLTIARTEYTIGIQDRDSGEQLSTIKYFEWGPNNRDQDLRSKYSKPMDDRYVYTKHDGIFYSLDLSSSDGYAPVPQKKPDYWQKVSSPIARVYDVVRPQDDPSGEASLVVLPQPVGPSARTIGEFEDGSHESVYINYTGEGSWYALSESNYPAVTDDAPNAKWPTQELWKLPLLSWPMSQGERERFIGVHQISPLNDERSQTPLIDAPNSPGLESPSDGAEHSKSLAKMSTPSWAGITKFKYVFATMALLVAYGFYRGQFMRPLGKIAMNSTTHAAQTQEIDQTPLVREAEPAREIIFPHDDRTSEDAVQLDDGFEKIDMDEIINEADDPQNADELKPKKKATRGKRGGKKVKEKEQQQAEARTNRSNSQAIPKPAGIISVEASESPQVSGPLQINSLIIHTDRIIGQGSCGTSVFEGSFEGRDVAVKRMLSQYYELASQEVSFLQQSDDHQNVVRYFCQQKDDHFLYIAVELCQASIFEIWEAEKAKTEERQLQMRSLKLSIQQDLPKALQQLAAGLYHLHNLRIIHRDIKPQNILVAFPKKHQNNGPRLVISDFGLGKNLPENVSTLVDPTGNAGTSGWKAPELISQPRDSDSKHSQNNSHTGGSESANGAPGGVKRAADIFSLGCLFFWVLTDGIHPYEDENGWQQLRELNIKRDNKKVDVLQRWEEGYEPLQLITWMLQHQPENRPTALQVLNHPFFWSAEKRLAFLCDCSDHFEREPRGVFDDYYAGDSNDLYTLERRAEEVFQAPLERADFLSKLDRQFVDTLGRQRKYSGYRLLDLLRALRNKKNHYEDMPEDVKKKIGSLPGGYLSYWSHRFPKLLMACYQVVHEAGLHGNDRFRGYFETGKV